MDLPLRPMRGNDGKVPAQVYPPLVQCAERTAGIDHDKLMLERPELSVCSPDAQTTANARFRHERKFMMADGNDRVRSSADGSLKGAKWDLPLFKGRQTIGRVWP